MSISTSGELIFGGNQSTVDHAWECLGFAIPDCYYIRRRAQTTKFSTPVLDLLSRTGSSFFLFSFLIMNLL